MKTIPATELLDAPLGYSDQAQYSAVCPECASAYSDRDLYPDDDPDPIFDLDGRLLPLRRQADVPVGTECCMEANGCGDTRSSVREVTLADGQTVLAWVCEELVSTVLRGGAEQAANGPEYQLR